MYYRGEFNGWSTNGMAYNLGHWRMTIQCTSNDNQSEFKFDDETDWGGTNWGTGNTNMSVNTKYTNYDEGGNCGFNAVSNNYYTFSFRDVGDNLGSVCAVLETSASPISISSVTDNSYGFVHPNKPVRVRITLSAAKSSEEKIYVCYTTDGWTSNNFVLAVSSNTTIYTCSIPGQAAGVTNEYYILSTTLTWSGGNDLDNYPDLMTLNWENNSGSNYQYFVRLGNCCHIPNNTEPGSHTMREPVIHTAGNTGIFYTGNYHPDGDQSGGILYWKRSIDSTYNSQRLVWFTNTAGGNNRYWTTNISYNSSWTNGERIQYFFKIEYATSDRSNTYIYTNNQKTIFYSTASNNPFEFTLNAAPKVTNLITPKDGDNQYYSIRPKFKWYRAIDKEGDLIDEYHIQVSTNNNFSDTVWDKYTGSGNTNIWYNCEVNLTVGKSYYWRVRAKDDCNGWGPYSQTNTFIVDPPFITIDGDGSDWGSSSGFSYGDNTCVVSNGQWMWNDKNNDHRASVSFFPENADIEEFRVTADTNNMFFYLKIQDITDGTNPYVIITLDTNLLSGSGNPWYLGGTEANVDNNAQWEKQIICKLQGTGVYDTSSNYNEAGASWIHAGNDEIEIAVPWDDLGFQPPIKVRFSVATFINNVGNPDEVTGADIIDCITTNNANTWDEVSDGTNNHYFDVYFYDEPYTDDHGGHIGLVWPDHLSMASSRGATILGLEFNITNKSHASHCGCSACQAENGSLVKDYNGTLTYNLSPTPSGDLLRAKTSGFVGGFLTLNKVILNHFGNPAKIQIQDSNNTSLTGSISIVSKRPNCIHINEVMFNPKGDDDENEWVELYSAFSNTLNLTNWCISDEDGAVNYTINQNLYIKSNNYLIIHEGSGTDDTDITNDGYGILYGEWTSWVPSVDTSDSGDELYIFSSSAIRNTNTVIDFVGWDGNGSPNDGWADYQIATNAGIWPNLTTLTLGDARIDNGNSIALNPDADDNDNPSDWISRAYATPGYQNNLHPVIQEVANSPGGNNYAEYIELFNPLPYSINFSNWAIWRPTGGDFNIRIVFTNRVLIKSNGFMLIGRNANNFYSVFKFYPDFEWDTANGGDNSLVPNMRNYNNTPTITNDNTIILMDRGDTTAVNDEVSVDIVVTGTGSANNGIPEGGWNGQAFGPINTSQALARIPDGKEGTEDDDNFSSDSDISAENNESLSNVFYLTNWDPNADDVYYVSPRYGNDSYTKFQARHIDTPWLTLPKAHNNMVPGDTCVILPGTNIVSFQITTSGSANSNITYTGYSNDSYIDGTGNYCVQINADYINLKDLNIIDAGQNGIEIVNSGHQGNIIKNNNIFSNTTRGMYINNVGNNTIYSNRIYNNPTGIAIFGSSNVIITNNIVRDGNSSGIYIQNSRGIKIKDNDFYNWDTWTGAVSLYNGTVSSYVENNFLATNKIGIRFDNSTNNFILNNTIATSTEHGIEVNNHAQGNLIKNNTIYQAKNNGIHFYITKGSNLVMSNRCYYNNNGIVLDSATNIYIKYNISTNNRNIGLYAGNSKSNYIYNNIFRDNANHGLYINNSDNNYIQDNKCYNNLNTGMFIISGSRDNYIINNRCSDADWAGILIQNGIHNMVYTNWCFGNNGEGIKIEQSSTNNVLVGNYCSTNKIGIFLDSGNVFSCTLINNICYSNRNYGISLETSGDNYLYGNQSYNNSSYGINVNNSIDNQLMQNIIYNNVSRGIQINASDGNLLQNNRIIQGNNAGDAVNVANSKNNIVLNNFIAQHSAGIALFNATNTIISGNEIKSNSGSGMWIGGACRSNVLFKNRLYRNNGDQIWNAATALNNVIIYNTFAFGGAAGISTLDNNITIKNCIFYSNNNQGVWSSGGGPTVTYSCFYGNNAGPVSGAQIDPNGSCITNQDPHFKSITPGSEDFHLQWNSPCQFAAETNKGVRAAMGAYPICVAPLPFADNGPSKHEVVFVSSYSNGVLDNSSVIYVNYSNASGGASAFQLDNTTKATTSSAWNAVFNSVNNNTALQSLNVQINSLSTPVPGIPQNIAFSTITNSSDSTNKVLFYIITSGVTNEYPELSNDFRVYTPDDFYVNDNSTTGDIYTTAVGSDTSGNGSRQKPYRTVTIILTNYTLTAGKNIWIDNGTFIENVYINSNHSGSKINYINIIGSGTNIGKSSLFIGSDNDTAFLLDQTEGINIIGIDVKRATNGIFILNSTNCKVEKCSAYSNAYGLRIQYGASNIFFNNDVYENNEYTTYPDGVFLDTVASYNTVRSNRIYNQTTGLNCGIGSFNNTITNNIFYNNTNQNMYLQTTYNNVIVDNYFSQVVKTGKSSILIFSNANNNRIEDNEFYTNNTSIDIQSASNNYILNNRIGTNLFAGINVQKGSYKNQVRNNEVFQCKSYGIRLYQVGLTNYVISNRCYYNLDGIHLSYTTNTFVQGNTSTNNTHGIYIYQSKDNIIQDNQTHNNGNVGIWLLARSKENIVSQNYSSGSSSWAGIIIQDSIHNQVNTNYCYKNLSQGISLNGNSTNNILNGNYCYTNGTFGIQTITNVSSSTLINNICYSNRVGIFLEGHGKSYLYNNECYNNYNAGAGWGGGILIKTSSANNLVENNKCYNNYDQGVGINIEYSRNNTLTNNFISKHESGIRLYYATNNYILNNSLATNEGEVISAVRSRSNLIKQNQIFSNSNIGIMIQEFSDYNSIISNTVFNQAIDDGIKVNQSSYNKIIGNTVYNVKLSGISLIASPVKYNLVSGNLSYSNNYGIWIDQATNNMIRSNISAFNDKSGIKLINCSANTLYNNAIYYNNWHGIDLDNADNCLIYNNSLASNGQSPTFHGIYIQNSSDNNEIVNCIIAFTKGSNGIHLNSGSAVLRYNNVYGNAGGNYGGTASPQSSSISNNPLWLSYDMNSPDFLTLSNASTSIDAGTNWHNNYIGAALDLGWKESPYTRYFGPFYVDDNSGDNSYPGTFIKPFLTIQRGVDRMSPAVNVTIATCYIFPGNYNEKVLISSNKNSGYMTFIKLSNDLPLMNGSALSNIAILIQNLRDVSISGLKIKSYTNGILLNNATNCRIESCQIFSNGYGIRVTNSKLLTVESNICYTNQIGIWIDQSISNNIINNVCSNNYYISWPAGLGIYIVNSSYNTFFSNQIVNNENSGIYFNKRCMENIVRKNTCQKGHNWAGIIVEGNHNQILTNWCFNNDGNGIKVEHYSTNNVLIGNFCFTNSGDGGGIYLYDSTVTSSTLIQNVSYKNRIGIELTNSSYNYLYNNICSNNNDIGSWPSGLGILLESSSYNIIYSNQAVNNQHSGIYFNERCMDNTVRKNICRDRQDWAGIVIEGVRNKIFTNWSFNNTSNGIKIEDYSTNNLIIGNYCYTNNDYGIQLSGVNVTSSTLINNICFHNTAGIRLDDKGNNYLYNNQCYDSDWNIWGIGLLLSGSSRNFILNNKVYNSLNDGIKIENGSSYNKIYTNWSFKNRDSGISIINGSTNNLLIGNYCSTNTNYGIYLYGNNVTTSSLINNVCFSNGWGIGLEDNGYNYVYNNNIYNNYQGVVGIGILIKSPSKNNIIDNNTIHKGFGLNNNDGIKLERTRNNIIRNNSITNYWVGIIIDRSTNNLISGNICYSNNDVGIYSGGGYSNQVKQNNIIKNVNDGIYMSDSSYNFIQENNIYSNSRHGMNLVNSCDGNIIDRNNIYYNSNNGINLDDDNDSCIIQQNKIYHNSGLGIFVGNNSDNNILFKNLLYRNTGDQIKSKGANNVITYNTIAFGGAAGIAVELNNPVIKNCIIYSNGPAGGIWADGIATPTAYFTCLYNTLNHNANVSLDSSCITNQDPLFKSITAGSEDFHLQWNSPCQFTAETNNGVQAAMGVYPVCVAPSLLGSGLGSDHEIVFVSSYSNYSINANDDIYIHYERATGNPSSFNLANVNQATTTSSWGATFSIVVNAGQDLQINIASGSTSPAIPENIICSVVTNDSDSTNRIRFYIIDDTTGETNYIPEYSNDFRIYTMTDFYVNDLFNASDIYTTAAGNDTTGNGTRQKPYASISKVINTYNLTGGNKVWVDNGIYNTNAVVSSSDSGTTGNYLEFIGAGTNSGKNTTLNGQSARNFGFKIIGSSWVKIMGFDIKRFNDTGAKLDNATNILITQNDIFSNQRGVYGNLSSSNNIFTNICFDNNDVQIMMENGNNNIIIGNPCRNGAWAAIIIKNANDCLVKGNSGHQAAHGMRVELAATNNVIIGNYFGTNNHNGLELKLSNQTRNTLKNNSCYSNPIGILIENAFNNVIKSNYCYQNAVVGVNGTGIYIAGSANNNYIANNICYENLNGMNGIGINVTSTANNNLLVQNICYDNSGSGIRLINAPNNNTLRSNNCYNNINAGIIIRDGSANNIIDRNRGSGTPASWAGIIVISANNNKIYTNRCVRSGEGIKIEGNSTNNLVKNNYCYTNYNRGIFLQGGNVTGSTLINNICYSNKHGIHIQNSIQNLLKNNDCYWNMEGADGHGIFIEGTADNNIVFSNYCYENNLSGLNILNGAQDNDINYNKFYNNSQSGIKINNSTANKIRNNYILTNSGNSGIMLTNSANNNYCVSNIIAYNESGIQINNSTGCTLFQNAVYHNDQHGIFLVGADNNFIFHNSIASNVQAAGNYDNVNLAGGSTGNQIINNIIAYAKTPTGYGLNIAGGGNINKYNDVYGNVSGEYGGVASLGSGSISNAPLWLSYDIYSTNFLYLSEFSACLDAATNLGLVAPVGAGPDMGWKEFTRPYVRIELSKSISNITRGGLVSSPIPGTTVLYKITYRITGTIDSTNMVIYDKIPVYTVYSSNFLGTATTWTTEFATNVSPNQSYISSDYKTNYSAKTDVKWIRWRKYKESPDGYKTLFYKVIIK